MNRAVILALVAGILSTSRPIQIWAADEVARVEVMAADGRYDLKVRVPNAYDYGYNPEVQDDRFRAARKAARTFCRNAQVVDEATIKTEILGITSSPPDRVVYLKCVAPKS